MSTPGNRDERLAELVNRAQAGDPEACNLLFGEYLEPVLRHVRRKMPRALRDRMDSRDVLQTGLREALSSLPEYEWRGGGSFYRWLCRIVEFKMIRKVSYWRAIRRDAAREEPLREEARSGPAGPPADEGPVETNLRRERKERLLEEIDRLAPREKDVMRESLSGLPDRIVGEKLGLSRDAVYRLRVAAVRKLAARLRELMD